MNWTNLTAHIIFEHQNFWLKEKISKFIIFQICSATMVVVIAMLANIPFGKVVSNLRIQLYKSGVCRESYSVFQHNDFALLSRTYAFLLSKALTFIKIIFTLSRTSFWSNSVQNNAIVLSFCKLTPLWSPCTLNYPKSFEKFYCVHWSRKD